MSLKELSQLRLCLNAVSVVKCYKPDELHSSVVEGHTRGSYCNRCLGVYCITTMVCPLSTLLCSLSTIGDENHLRGQTFAAMHV